MDGKVGDMQDFQANRFGKVISNTYLSFTLRIVLGSVFVYASWDKIAHPDVFAMNIRNYQMIPALASNFLAMVLPWLELYCGLALIFGFFLRGSALLIAGMLIVFIIALTSALLRGLDIDCGCYKTMEAASKVGLRRIIEDIAMLLMAVQIFFADHSFASLDYRFSGNVKSFIRK